MPKLRNGLSVALMGTLFLVGAGCGPVTPPVQPPAPPTGQDDRMMPPEDGMQNDEMMHDTSTMPMGDASGTAMGGMMQPKTPPELTAEQSAELSAGEAAHKPSELTFHIKGGNFFFVPNMIKVKKGDKVTIVFENTGGMHNLNITEFNVNTQTIKITGETATIEFVADKTGSFEYFCDIGQHRAMGQKGTLIVE